MAGERSIPGQPANDIRRIAFFVQDLRGGGAERSVVRLVNGVAKRGYPTDLIVMKAEGPFLAEVDPAVRVVTLDVARTAKAVPALRRYIEESRPVALFSAMTHTNVVSVIAARLARFRTRLILVEHNQFAANRRRKRGMVRLAYGLVPLVYRFADRIAGVSSGVRDSIAEAARLPVSRVDVLYNPIVTPELAQRGEETVEHPWLGANAPVLLAVGRLMPQKNFSLLIEALALIRDRTPARLIILGEGEERAALEQQVRALGLEDRVDLPGFRPNPFAFMRRCQLYVMSSDWEGLPTVLIEALALGMPVVSTDCRHGPAEILDKGRFGRLVPTGDAVALGDAILAALANPGDAAPRLARASDFSADKAIDAYLALAGLSTEAPRIA